MIKLNELLLHPFTKTQLMYLLQSPPQAILITGDNGSGKTTIAKALAASLLETDSLDAHPYFLPLKRLNIKQEIAIEQVRSVIKKLQLKVPTHNAINRVVFIEDAHFLSLPAQNTLLKILEEPASGTLFLLSTTSEQNVLPTIASRTQILNVQNIDLKRSLGYWNSQYKAEDIESAWRLSGGSVGLMHALLSNESHPLKEAVGLARKFLRTKTYERLLIMNSISDSREELGLFLDALARILNFLHHSALTNHRSKQAKSLLASRKMLQRHQEAFLRNVNAKILGLSLTLSLDL